MENKKYSIYLVLGIALLIIVGLFLYLGSGNNNGKKTPSQMTNEKSSTKLTNSTTNVVITKDGFVPKDVHIPTGGTVVWQNTTDEEATVNSDDHPTHKLYPILNLGSFEKNSSVQAQFITPGRYTYHNHFHPEQKGTITVVK